MVRRALTSGQSLDPQTDVLYRVPDLSLLECKPRLATVTIANSE